jgi:hypothetical protein
MCASVIVSVCLQDTVYKTSSYRVNPRQAVQDFPPPNVTKVIHTPNNPLIPPPPAVDSHPLPPPKKEKKKRFAPCPVPAAFDPD